MNNFNGRHILITGASSGIGLATALMAASRGANLSLIARTSDKLEAAVKIINDRFGAVKAIALVADVGDRSALLAAFDEAEQGFGPIEGLFANAGTGGAFAPLTSYDDELFDTVLRVNLISIFWSIKRVMPAMMARKSGSILITGSLASKRGMANNIAYVASKHGVLGLARAAALEAAPSQVRVNCLIPGLIETPMLMNIDPNSNAATIRANLAQSVPQGRIGQAEEVAELACFLLSDAASHLTAQAIAVDGGILGTNSLK